VGLIARQAREVGIKVPLLGGDAWDAPALIPLAGDALEGSYFSNHYSSEDKSPAVQKFIRKFKKAYQEVPAATAALGFDSAMILADAMKRAKELTPSAIRDALAQTKNFPGVTGSITIDKDRNAIKPVVILKIKNGQFKYETTLDASSTH
jgi:branched-chain amino acid transport system substrate-binding protein